MNIKSQIPKSKLQTLNSSTIWDSGFGAWDFLVRPLRSSRGSYLVLLAMMTVIFAGVGGMIFEMNKSMALRTHMQSVADLAALAAGREYFDKEAEIDFDRIHTIIKTVVDENGQWLGNSAKYDIDKSENGVMMGFFEGIRLARDEDGKWKDYQFTPFDAPYRQSNTKIKELITTKPNTESNSVRVVLEANEDAVAHMLQVLGLTGKMKVESIAQICADGSIALYGMCAGGGELICNNNGIQDNDETGVDCGGSACPSCCGNNQVDSGEECDRGGTNGTPCPEPAWTSSAPGNSCNYCSLLCTNVTKHGPYCGDGSVHAPDETCEPPNTATCDASCHTSPPPACRWVKIAATIGGSGSSEIELEVDPAAGAKQYYKKTISGAGGSLYNDNLFCIASSANITKASIVPGGTAVDFTPTASDCGECDVPATPMCCPIEGCEEPKVTDKEGRTELQKDPHLG